MPISQDALFFELANSKMEDKCICLMKDNCNLTQPTVSIRTSLFYPLRAVLGGTEGQTFGVNNNLKYSGDPFLPGVARVGSLRVLGVEVSSNLSMETHLDGLISNYASSIHALRMLRTHGLPPAQLQEVARMTTISSLLYASLAWWGFTSAHDHDRLERLVKRLRRSGYLPESAPSFAEMAQPGSRSLPPPPKG